MIYSNKTFFYKYIGSDEKKQISDEIYKQISNEILFSKIERNPCQRSERFP